MNPKLIPYLGFKDDAREAMTFYQTVFGGKLTISTFGEYHASEDPSEADKVMHAQLEGDHGITFMAADTPNHMEYKPGSTISMSLSGGPDEAEVLNGYYSELMDGGMAPMPFETAPWGDKFGMVVDKFGTTWMINIAGKKAE